MSPLLFRIQKNSKSVNVRCPPGKNTYYFFLILSLWNFEHFNVSKTDLISFIILTFPFTQWKNVGLSSRLRLVESFKSHFNRYLGTITKCGKCSKIWSQVILC